MLIRYRAGMSRFHALALVPALVFAAGLVGCSSEPDPTPPAAATTTSSEVDRTADVQKAAGDTVTRAVESEPGRFEVETTIVDPRGEEGSDEAKAAIAICSAVVELGATYVRVLEQDGTTFAIYAPSQYGEECAEV